MWGVLGGGVGGGGGSTSSVTQLSSDHSVKPRRTTSSVIPSHLAKHSTREHRPGVGGGGRPGEAEGGLGRGG